MPNKNKLFFGFAVVAIILLVQAFVVSSQAFGSDEQSRQVVFVGADVPPFSWSEGGEVKGINVEILQEAAKRLGYESRQKIVPLKRAFKMLETYPDHFMVGLARTPDREASFKWVAPLIHARIAMLSLKNKTLHSEAIRAEVCVHYGTPMESWLKRNGWQNYMAVTNEQACLKLLQDQLVNNWFTELHLAKHLAAKQGIELRTFAQEKVIMTPTLYMAAPLGTPDEEVEKWRRTLDSMAEQGRFEQIKNRYLLAD